MKIGKVYTISHAQYMAGIILSVYVRRLVDAIKNIDEFVRVFSTKLANLDISKDILEYTLVNMRVADFCDKDLLILPVCHTGNGKYKGLKHRREFSKNVQIGEQRTERTKALNAF